MSWAARLLDRLKRLLTGAAVGIVAGPMGGWMEGWVDLTRRGCQRFFAYCVDRVVRNQSSGLFSCASGKEWY